MTATAKTAAQLQQEAELLLSRELLHQSEELVKSLRKDDAPADEPPPDGVDDDAPPADDVAAPSSETPPPAEEGSEEWSMEDIVAALSAVPPEQLPMWKQAIDQVMGGSGEAGGEEMPPEDEAPPMEALKSELLKMEQRLQKNIDARISVLAKSAPRPQRRSAAATAPAAPRPARLDKAEIDKRLSVKVRDPRLTKDDRAAVNHYYTSGQVDADPIRHLLKD